MAKKKKEELEEVVETVEEDVEEVEEKPKAKPKKPKKKTFKDIKKAMETAEVLIQNNEDGMFFYKNPKTNEVIDFLEYGDTEIVEADFLYTMKTSKKIFEQYQILILDVYCDDETITIQDVYTYLGIDKLYKNVEIPTTEYLDELLLEEDIEEFERATSNMNKNIYKRLADRAIMLAKKGKLRDSYKKSLIEERLKREDLFSDIEKKRNK